MNQLSGGYSRRILLHGDLRVLVLDACNSKMLCYYVACALQHRLCCSLFYLLLRMPCGRGVQPAGCMQPVVTFVNYIYKMKNHAII
jgi:hypothetical protein